MNILKGIGGILMLCVILTTTVKAQTEVKQSASHTNVIFILIDDLGFGDLSVTGNALAETPNIDELAKQGTMFTQFYSNSPICSPARVAFTTGQYPQNYQISSFIHNREHNKNRGMKDYLDPDAFTLADGFKSVGYNTAHIGKWHMGGGRDVDDAPHPKEYGFDYSYVSFEGLGDRLLFSDHINKLSAQSAKLGQGDIDWQEKHTTTGTYVEKSIAYIQSNKKQPFYLQLWLNDVHDPHMPSDLNFEAYSGQGRDKNEDKFFAVLENMDKQLGRLFTYLKREGLDKNTLIVLTSDNGPVSTAKYYKNGSTPPGSTAGLRGRKWSLYEGGIRMPLITKWPLQITPNRIDNTTVMAGIDLLPTLADIFSFDIPKVNGISIRNAWFGKPIEQRSDPIMWEFGTTGNVNKHPRSHIERDRSPGLAIRMGDLKLLVNPDGSDRQLFNIKADPFEKKNIASQHPLVTDNMSHKVMQWRSLFNEHLENERPNIVVYLSDDHSQFDSSLFDNTSIHTPNLAALAKTGMNFTHAYVASPSCAPSRAALLTGLMPARNGAEDNHTHPSSEIPSLIEEFNKLGYETVAFGKVAHGKNRAKRFGFSVIEEEVSLPLLSQNVKDFLTQRKSKKPLLIFVGTSNPHVPWDLETNTELESVVLPPHYIDTPDTRLHRAAYEQEVTQLDAFLGELRAMIIEQLGSDHIFLHTSDHGAQWPFGKWTLYDYGTRVPMIFSWPNKIATGLEPLTMVSWVDLLPTLLELARNDQTNNEALDNIDGKSFAPVLLGKRDEHRDYIFTTHSGDKRKNVYPIRAVRTQQWKLIHNLYPDYVFTNHSDLLRNPGAGRYWTEWVTRAKLDPGASAIVNKYYHRPEYEFYHMTEDKWEQTNLIDSEEHQTTISELKKILIEWRTAQGDSGNTFMPPYVLDEPSRWHPDYFKGQPE
jgi:uncharacterized sulfatase